MVLSHFSFHTYMLSLRQEMQKTEMLHEFTSLHKGHANLCVGPNLVYVLPKPAQYSTFNKSELWNTLKQCYIIILNDSTVKVSQL